MRGYPQYLNSRQDFINMIRDDIDREATKAHLQALLNTAKRMEPIWPDGYDPSKPLEPAEEPVQPVSWKEVDNPGGSIFLMGFTADEVTGLMEIEQSIKPFNDNIGVIRAMVEGRQFQEAKTDLAALEPSPSWLHEPAATALAAEGDLDALLDAQNPQAEDLDQALAVLDTVQTDIDAAIEARIAPVEARAAVAEAL